MSGRTAACRSAHGGGPGGFSSDAHAAGETEPDSFGSCGSRLGEVFQRKKDRGKHAVFIRQLQPQQFVLLRLFLCRILVIGYYRIKQACKLKFI